MDYPVTCHFPAVSASTTTVARTSYCPATWAAENPWFWTSTIWWVEVVMEGKSRQVSSRQKTCVNCGSLRPAGCVCDPCLPATLGTCMWPSTGIVNRTKCTVLCWLLVMMMMMIIVSSGHKSTSPFVWKISSCDNNLMTRRPLQTYHRVLCFALGCQMGVYSAAHTCQWPLERWDII